MQILLIRTISSLRSTFIKKGLTNDSDIKMRVYRPYKKQLAKIRMEIDEFAFHEPLAENL